MPYIRLEDRKRIIDQSGSDPRSIGQECKTPGELNYCITTMLHDYIDSNGGVNYSNINEVIGVLECAKLELYRRITAPYEDKKCKENGDV